MNNYKRVFASFSGRCPYACLHCYTYIPNYTVMGEDSIDKIITNIKEKNPDIIYVSGHKENFINPDKGLELCERLFDEYHCDLLLTTRNIFNNENINRLAKLNKKMKLEGKDLFFCTSIPALESFRKLENNCIIPTPEERIKFLSKVYNEGIYTFLTIKPLCPNEFIPIEEILNIIDKCKEYSTAVLSSGIIVNSYILKKLKDFPVNFKSQQAPLMKCLQNNINVQYVDVTNELNQIKAVCNKYNVPFFEHSLPAIEYIKKLKK